MLERRCLDKAKAAVKLEKRGEGEAAKPVIVGYASVFYNEASPDGTQYMLWDDFCERILPGAFDRAIAEDDVRGLVNHDPSQLLGRTKAGTMRLSVDAVGLRYEIDPPDTQCGRDVQTSISRGDMTGSSFGFQATDVTWREVDGMTIREIRAVSLLDCSPVTYPAYDGTSTSVRSAHPEQLRNEFDKFKAEQQGLVAARQRERDRVQVRADLIAMGLE